MSAGEFLREVIGVFPKLSRGLVGWIFIALVAKLMPRRHDCIAVIGREDGKFLDNAKYFSLQASPALLPSVQVTFVTERSDVADMLIGADCKVMVYPSLRSIKFLLRVGVLVVDSSEWVWRYRRFFLIGAKKVQLWHGVGYKRIELDKWKNEAKRSVLSASWMPFVRRTMKMVNGRLVRFDVVNTTSEFYKKEVFEPAMLAHRFTVFGYPRNTFGDLDDSIRALAWKNVDEYIVSQIDGWVEEERHIVLIAPTYKDTRASRMGLDRDTVAMLDEFCERQKIEFVFKFHPLERGASKVQGEHLHLCDPDSDLYPLMPLSNALVTDYSSIYMDYLLLDKPVLFLVPDLDDYVLKDRQFQFDFDEMTPGPKLTSWKEVVSALTDQWRQDDYVQERARLRRLAFDDLPQDQAVPKLIAFMREQGWLAEASKV